MGYFKPNTKKAIKLAMFVKGITASIGVSALLSDYKWVGIATLIIGAVANELINVLSDNTNENTII